VSVKLGAKAALRTSGALPENINDAIKSSFLPGFLESVPEVAAKLHRNRRQRRKRRAVHPLLPSVASVSRRVVGIIAAELQGRRPTRPEVRGRGESRGASRRVGAGSLNGSRNPY